MMPSTGFVFLILKSRQSTGLFLRRFSRVSSHIDTLYDECTLQLCAILRPQIKMMDNSVCLCSQSTVSVLCPIHSKAKTGRRENVSVVSTPNVTSNCQIVLLRFKKESSKTGSHTDISLLLVVFCSLLHRCDCREVKRHSDAQVLSLSMGGGNPQ